MCVNRVRDPNRNHILLIPERKPKDTQMEYRNWRKVFPRGGGRAPVFVNPYHESIVGG